MHKQVYDRHKALVDSMICDALASTDSPSEKLAIIQAHRDALAAFMVIPSPAVVASELSAEVEPATENDMTNIEVMPARKRKKAATD